MRRLSRGRDPHDRRGEPTLASPSLTPTSVILDLPQAVNLYHSFSSCGDSPNYKIFVTMSIIVILLLLENHNANICVFPSVLGDSHEKVV